ncbi:DUF2165 domain-containing protein [Dyella sp.]|uniref:DUF2165 family protein n=1 Tax=Dyella sp. TaxID=1869338 RepID=UPI002ECFD684
MIGRLAKIMFVAALALEFSLVAFGNITDYGSNLVFVQHVLAMDSIFPNAAIHYRAIRSVPLQHVVYLLIILGEALAAMLCWWGVGRLWRRRGSAAAVFERAKSAATAGLCVGLLVWMVGFIGIGGEWFGMWMSEQWNGLEAAFRLTVLIVLALLLLGQRDAELE